MLKKQAQEVAKMKLAWNKRASSKPFYYVETKHWDGDPKQFFDLGEERSRIFLDPVLREYSLSSSLNVIDYGCGLGRFTQALARRFERVIGVDVSEVMIERAQSLNLNVQNVSFLVGNGISIPVPDNSFEFVFSYEVFQHMPSHSVIRSTIQDVARVMKHGSFALIHFRTARERSQIAYNLAALIPDRLISLAKGLLQRDPLTADAAWRGAEPLGKNEISALCQSVGFRVVEFRDDPTHAAGSRTFAFLQKVRV